MKNFPYQLRSIAAADSGTGAWHGAPLEPTEFLRRWSLHVLPKGLMRVRHYGFLSAAGKKQREPVATIIGVQPPGLPPVVTDPGPGRKRTTPSAKFHSDRTLEGHQTPAQHE